LKAEYSGRREEKEKTEDLLSKRWLHDESAIKKSAGKLDPIL